MRLIAIGDIHGQQDKLTDLLAQIAPTDKDQFVFLGDYVDRGDSAAVIDSLISFCADFPQTVFIRGNHDQDALDDPYRYQLTQEQIIFLRDTQLYFELDQFIFAHAGMNPYLPLEQQDPKVLLWDRDLGEGPAGKTLVIGHTPTIEGEPLIADDLIMLDTGAGWGGPLTAMDLLTGQVWQAG